MTYDEFFKRAFFYRAFPHRRAQIPSSVMAEAGKSPILPVGPEIPSSAMTNSSQGGPAPVPVENILRLSWTNWIELLHLDDPWKRAFYENECLKGIAAMESCVFVSARALRELKVAPDGAEIALTMRYLLRLACMYARNSALICV